MASSRENSFAAILIFAETLVWAMGRVFSVNSSA
jgi:hypothetical protein